MIWWWDDEVIIKNLELFLVSCFLFPSFDEMGTHERTHTRNTHRSCVLCVCVLLKWKHVRTHGVQEVSTEDSSIVCAEVVSGILVKLGNSSFKKINYDSKCIRDNCVENIFFYEFWKGVLSSGGHIFVKEFINCSCFFPRYSSWKLRYDHSPETSNFMEVRALIKDL